MRPFHYGTTSSTNFYFANQSGAELQVRVTLVKDYATSPFEYLLYSTSVAAYANAGTVFNFAAMTLPSYNPMTDKIFVRVSSSSSTIAANYSFFF